MSKRKSVTTQRQSYRGECSNVRAGKSCSEHDHSSSRTTTSLDVEGDEHELDVEEIVRHWKGQDSWQPNVPVRRRFILQLAVALHSYGSTASRTEFLIDKAAHRLNIETCIAVFPSLILLSFPGTAEYELSRKKHSSKSKSTSHRNFSYVSRKEMHMLTVESALDVDKLGHVDELTSSVGRSGTPFAFAYWRLKTILNSPPFFDKWYRLFGYAISGATSAPLFFDGGLWDAAFCFVLSTAVGILDWIASDNARFATILEFCAAALIAFLSRCCIFRFQSLKLCYIALTLGSLTQLLPGMSLTLGASEMISKSRLTGTADIVRGLYSSMQLGFGLAFGENLVWWAGEPPKGDPCADSGLPLWVKLIWLLGYACGSNILMMARFEQWPGMTITAFAGYVVSTVTSDRLPSTTSSAISAFAVGITGNTYSYFTGTLPLAMIISGVNLLVPGGIGVQGVASMVKNNGASAGVGFVFEMIVVALSLTIGLLVAKLVMPAAIQVTRPMSFRRANLPTLMTNLPSLLMDAEQVLLHSSSSSSSDTGGDMAL